MALLMSCYPELGPCDPVAARSVAHDGDGTPFYEGQAILNSSCGRGSLCHSEDARGAARFGAPGGLDFCVDLATTEDPVDEDGAARLARNQRRVLDNSFRIARSLERGTMPPEGHWESGIYARGDGSALPSAESDEGRDILFNWLACGAPVVERTTFPPAGAPEVGDVVPMGAAAGVEPTFATIFERVLYPRCGISCHGPNVPAQLALAHLDLSTPERASDALLRDNAAGGDSCAGEGPLVVPGRPDESLLVQKLEGTQDCGGSMPGGSLLSVQSRDAIRAWVMSGASE